MGLSGALASSSTSSTTSTSSSTPTSSTEPPSEPRVCPNGYHAYDQRYPIQLCDEGPAVRYIQEKTGAPVDGAFGPTTRQSVRVFQEERGLPADGLVGPATWTAMFPDGAPGVDADGNGTVEPWEVS
jgi:peptidoglycan hydrolase-like protein with peptidoglycan-binding domain